MQKSTKKIGLILIIVILSISIYIGLTFWIESFSPKPESRMFPDMFCQINQDCNMIDCTNLNSRSAWYCDRDGFPICNVDKICACASTCL